MNREQVFNTNFISVGYFLIFFLILGLADASRADDLFVINDTIHADLLQSRNNEVQRFITDLSQSLPLKIQAQIKQPIQIQFSRLEKKPLVFPTCEGFSRNYTSQYLPKSENGSSLEYSDADVRIQLHSDFLESIFKGSLNSITSSCGGLNFYQLAQIEVLSQVINWFAATSDLGLETHSLTWKAILLRLEPKSNIDDEDLRNVFFAKYLALKLIDPNFVCHLPSVNEYFNSLQDYNLPVRPDARLAAPACSLNSTIWTTTSDYKLNLDFRKLYQIHLLVASEGSSFVSANGHVMFRLILCGPQRRTVDSECLKDLDSHVVLSFLGLPNTLQYTIKDGFFTGLYPVRMNVEGFTKVLNQYTVDENRSLTSIPLALTSFEKQIFYFRFLEEYWSYRGNYYFLSNNCATESLHFLQSITWDRMQTLKEDPLVATPYGLRDFLYERKLLKVLPANKLTEPSLYYFPPAKMKNLDQNEPVTPSESVSFDSKERKEDFLRNKNGDKEHDRNLASKYYEQEMTIFQNLDAKVTSIITWISIQDPANLKSEYRQWIQEIQANQRTLAPIYKAQMGGYGIPLSSDLRSESYASYIKKQMDLFKRKLKSQLHKDLPQIFQEMKESNDNMRYFYEFINPVNVDHILKEML